MLSVLVKAWEDCSEADKDAFRKLIGKKKPPPVKQELLLPDSPVLMAIPLATSGAEFMVTERYVKQLEESFPGVDISVALRRIRQWNIDNPARRKTQRGIRTHISNWLGRDQDRAARTKSGPELRSRDRQQESIEAMGCEVDAVLKGERGDVI